MAYSKLQVTILKKFTFLSLYLLITDIFHCLGAQMKSDDPPQERKNIGLRSSSLKPRWLVDTLLITKRSSIGARPNNIAQFGRAKETSKYLVHQKHLIKRPNDSVDRSLLKKYASIFKEEEDAALRTKGCKPKLDLAFVMDSCGRVCTEFIKNVISRFTISKHDCRVGVVLYSQSAKRLFGFDDFSNIRDVFSALDNITFVEKQPGKGENIGAALSKTRGTLFAGNRRGVPRVLIVISTTQAIDDIMTPAKRLRDDGVTIYGVGFGNEFNTSQIKSISSRPTRKHVFVEEPRMSLNVTQSLRDELCRSPASVVFLLDGSENVGLADIQSYKVFVKDVSENIIIPPGGIKFGVLECGAALKDQKSIRTFANSAEFDETIDGIVPTHGRCELGKSLERINQETFDGLSNVVPKALIVILAGKSDDDVVKAASKLKKNGVRIIALGTGPRVDMRQLFSIAASPLYAFKVPMFEYLLTMSSTVVGLINEVTEPHNVIHNIPVSKDEGDFEGEDEASFQDDLNSLNLDEVNQAESNESSLVESVYKAVNQLDHQDSWYSGRHDNEPQQRISDQERNASLEESNSGSGLSTPGSKLVNNVDNSSPSQNNTNNGSSLESVNDRVAGGQEKGNQVTAPAYNIGVMIMGNNTLSGGSSKNVTGGLTTSSFGKQTSLGPPKVIQTQLLTIPVLPVQTIAVQSFPLLQSLMGQVPTSNSPATAQRQSAANQSQILPGNNQVPNKENRTKLNPFQISRGNENKTNGTLTTNSTASKGGELGPHTSKAAVDQGKLQKDKPTSPLSGPLIAFKLDLDKQTSLVPTQELGSNNNSNKIIESNLHAANGKGEIQSEASLTPSATGVSEGNGTAKKLKDYFSIKPPLVLCQIVCGTSCCPPAPNSPSTTAKPTVATTKSSPAKVPTTTKGASSPETKPPQDVIGAPPVPLRHPHHPSVFPQGPSPTPLEETPIEATPLPDEPSYTTVPVTTTEPVITSHNDNIDPVYVGQCQDFHPDCSSFVMAGMCDQPSPFKDAFNVREFCMLSCGICNRFVKHGHDVTFDVRSKSKPAEEIGFPEYSKKFLKRNIH